MSYAIWSLVLFVVISLWAVAMSEIGVHLRQGMLSAASLATMATVISAVAIVAMIAAGVAFFGAPPRADALTGSSPAGPGCTGGVRGTFIFSFGLERGSQPLSDCPGRNPED
ncbi:MAG: hypothetical protein CYG60_02015 [Actinobacteria bacterium]|jgi:hypothetical protein|nr:hypothetical protein [Actinomycetota bacterium]PLS87419.1 MAG: hypothetical protein CYG60_02015 [Actinomycetota bacterium]